MARFDKENRRNRGIKDVFGASPNMNLQYNREEECIPIIALEDDFNDNSIDVTKWNLTNPNSVISEQNNRLEINELQVEGTISPSLKHTVMLVQSGKNPSRRGSPR